MDADDLQSRWRETLGEAADLTQLSTLATFKPRSWQPLVSPLAAPTEPFQCIEEIGRGGMGAVFRARQLSLGRDVALKMLHGADSGSSNQSLPGFLAEAYVTGRLDHPNIVPVYDLGQTRDGAVYYAMKLVGGHSWGEKLKAGADDLEAQLAILDQVCNAVAFAHSRGVLHNDLKPANVMVGPFGEVLLMDWGLAVSFGDATRAAGLPHCSSLQSPCGTPGYMPPELAEGRGEDLGPWTDIYLLGAILFELLSGRPPHVGRSFLEVVIAAALGRCPEPPSGAPAGLVRLMRRALSAQPEARHPDVASFQRELRQHLQHRESLQISELAREQLASCRQRAAAQVGQEAGSALLYEGYAEAVAGFCQARRLWPESDEARSGEREARLECAAMALGLGDLGLAEGQLARLEPGPDVAAAEAALREGREQRARSRRQARRTRRRLRLALAGLMGVLLLGLVAALGFNRVLGFERDKLAAEQERSGRRENQVAAALQDLFQTSEELLVSVGTTEAGGIRDDLLRVSLQQWESLLTVTRSHEFALGTSRALLNIGLLRSKLGELELARSTLDAACGQLREAHARMPSQPERARLLLNALAASCALEQGEAASRLRQEALELSATMLAAGQTDARVLRAELLLQDASQLWAEERWQAAEMRVAQLLAQASALVAQAGEPVVCAGQMLKARLAERRGDNDAALQSYDASLQLAREALQKASGFHLPWRLQLIELLHARAALRARLGDTPGAVSDSEEQRKLAAELVERDPSSPRLRLVLADACYLLGTMLRSEPARAATFLSEALEHYREEAPRRQLPELLRCVRALRDAARQAVSSDPVNARALDEQAIALYEGALRHASDSATIAVFGAELAAETAERAVLTANPSRAAELFELSRSWLERQPATRSQQDRLILTLRRIAELQLDKAAFELAAATVQELIARIDQLRLEHPDDKSLSESLGQALVLHVWALFGNGENSAAGLQLQRLLSEGAALAQDDERLILQLSELARTFAQRARAQNRGVEAIQLLQVAVQTARQALSTEPDSVLPARLLAQCLFEHGRLLETLKAAEPSPETRDQLRRQALAAFDEARVLARTLITGQASSELQALYVACLAGAAVTLADEDLDAAEALLSEAFALHEQIPLVGRSALAGALALSERLVQFAEICGYYGAREPSGWAFEAAISVAERAAAAFPEVGDVLLFLTNHLQRAYVNAHAQGWLEEAEDFQTRLSSALARTAQPGEDSQVILRAEATLGLQTAQLQLTQSKLHEARASFEAALHRIEVLAEPGSNQGKDRRWAVTTRCALGMVCLRLRDLEAAGKHLRQAVSDGHALLSSYPENGSFRTALAKSLAGLAQLEAALGSPEPARQALQEACQLLRSVLDPQVWQLLTDYERQLEGLDDPLPAPD